MFEASEAAWNKVSKLGMSRYILQYGVACWGVPVAIMFSLLQTLQCGLSGFTAQLIVSLFLFTITGATWSFFTWRLMEMRYVRASVPRSRS